MQYSAMVRQPGLLLLSHGCHGFRLSANLYLTVVAFTSRKTSVKVRLWRRFTCSSGRARTRTYAQALRATDTIAQKSLISQSFDFSAVFRAIDAKP